MSTVQALVTTAVALFIVTSVWSADLRERPALGTELISRSQKCSALIAEEYGTGALDAHLLSEKRQHYCLTNSACIARKRFQKHARLDGL